jgi:predicted ATP-binding protein involved in virulence
MITRIQAFHYRCFEHLGLDLRDPYVIVGANGFGKTTLMDIPCLPVSVTKASNISSTFLVKNHRKVARASTLTELVHHEQGETIMFGLAARLPDDITHCRQSLHSKT